VLLEVLREFGNPPRQQRDLDLRGSNILAVKAMLGDDLFLDLWHQGHSAAQDSLFASLFDVIREKV
jgi:hypothetical protein